MLLSNVASNNNIYYFRISIHKMMSQFGKFSQRIQHTTDSVIKQAQPFMKPGVINMAQGMVHWTPPVSALESTKKPITELPSIHKYGAIEGNSDVLSLLKEKLAKENNITNKDIMLTAGSNQAFLNVVLTLCDPGDEVILFAPYFFNHMMTLQLANVKAVVIPPRLDDLTPNLDQLRFSDKTKIVVLVSPSNPSGAVVPPETIKKIQQQCYDAGVWLVSDEAYEYFVHEDGVKHYSPQGDNVINLYTFSKGPSMAGWRVGYIAYPPHLKDGLDKVQDSVPINVTQISQHLAASVLKLGPEWIQENVRGLKYQRELVWDAIKDMEGTVKTAGAFYFLIKLPEGVEDIKAVEYLATKWQVLVIPCTNCGLSGYLRVSYAALSKENAEEAAGRLKNGLKAIREGKMEL